MKRVKHGFMRCLFITGIVAMSSVVGYGVTTSIGPSAERRVETRSRTDSDYDRKGRDSEKENEPAASVEVPGVANVSVGGVSVRFSSGRGYRYRPYYSHYPYRRGYRYRHYRNPYYRSYPYQYQNYYMYRNYYNGW
ncbi:MAG: hypothetical protein S4CHLAM45_14760 [Chlamydiales bacterium]|nr:hypothetical protein [Chlamydiales bacterium]MCH9620562.1 hypothetical protein [Chlamydiales bacterium]MCH9623566.1 hypothetical protein [Chlamydiales bacterium]